MEIWLIENWAILSLIGLVFALIILNSIYNEVRSLKPYLASIADYLRKIEDNTFQSMPDEEEEEIEV